MRKLNKKGFTLTEMIVVIAIIGILAAVMIPGVVIYVQRAQKSNDEQLAASMTDEIERYCIDAGIERSDLLGTDVKSILSFKEYDLTPSRNKWAYVYDSESGIISVTDLSTVVVDTSLDFVDPTNFRGNLHLLSSGDSKIEQIVSILCRVQSSDAYNKAAQLAQGDDSLAKLVQHFNPEQTLYISNTKVFTKYSEGNHNLVNIVFTEKTVHIPTLFASNLKAAYGNNPSNFEANFVDDKFSAIIKTIEKDINGQNQDLLTYFPKLKVMDQSNLIMLNDQFIDDIDELISGSSFLTPSFKLGDNYETALFMSFDFMPVETITKIRVEVENGTNVEYKVEYSVTRLTISYYNENGLFARATNLYAKEISKTKVETNSTQN